MAPLRTGQAGDGAGHRGAPCLPRMANPHEVRNREGLNYAQVQVMEGAWGAWRDALLGPGSQ